jgi:hypothetical protein
LALTKLWQPDQHVGPQTKCVRQHGDPRKAYQAPTENRHEHTRLLCRLRGPIAAHLALERGKSKSENRQVCRGIRVPSNLLQAWAVRDFREKAEKQEVSWITLAPQTFSVRNSNYSRTRLLLRAYHNIQNRSR